MSSRRVSFGDGQIGWGLGPEPWEFTLFSHMNSKSLTESLHLSGPQFPCQVKGSTQVIASFLLVLM